MKRSVLVIVVVVLAMLVSTVGLSAKQGVIRDNAKVELEERPIKYKGACGLPVYLNGTMHVRTDMTPGKLSTFEQHVNMQGVDGYQVKSGRSFRLVGASAAEGAMTCNYTQKPATCYSTADHVFTLVEQGTQGEYLINLRLTVVFLGDEVVQYKYSFSSGLDLCPVE